jgi:hypothetical protein
MLATLVLLRAQRLPNCIGPKRVGMISEINMNPLGRKIILSSNALKNQIYTTLTFLEIRAIDHGNNPINTKMLLEEFMIEINIKLLKLH